MLGRIKERQTRRARSVGSDRRNKKTPPMSCFPHAFMRQCNVHCVSINDTDVAHYNFNARQPILVIFGRYIAE